MTTLQIVSFESCGKTALCAGIGKKLANSGKKVGYIKPVHMNGGLKDDCKDAIFIKEALELSENIDQLCPMQLSQEDLWRNLSEDVENFSNKIKVACERVSQGKDILIVESPGSLKNDQVSALASYTITDKLVSRVILLICYSTDFKDTEILQVAQKLGDRLLGIVLNQVPESKLSIVQEDCTEYFKSKGINVMGILPESRALLGVSIKEIAAAIGGEIISSEDRAEDLIENIMLGAMTPDSARDYYSRKRNKAVVSRSDRADMQLAALETSTKCLIVTKQKPNTSVMVKAEDKKVPVMLVDRDIKGIVAGIEQTIAKAKFQSTQKLQAMMVILDNRFDFKSLNSAVGLK